MSKKVIESVQKEAKRSASGSPEVEHATVADGLGASNADDLKAAGDANAAGAAVDGSGSDGKLVSGFIATASEDEVSKKQTDDSTNPFAQDV